MAETPAICRTRALFGAVRAVLGLFALAGAATVPASAGVRYETIGPWTIEAFDGMLCSAQAGARGIDFSIQLLKDGRWWLGLSNQAWTLPAEDHAVGVLVAVGSNSILTRSRSVQGRLILIEVNDLAPLGPLRSNQRIDLVVLGGENGMPDQTVRLPLPDIEAVIPAVTRCAAALR